MTLRCDDNYYFTQYEDDEPVNRCTFDRNRNVTVKFNPKFFDKVVIAEAISQLPDKLKETAELLVIKRMQPMRISEHLGLHKTTVYRRIRTIEDILRKKLRKVI